MKKRKIRIMGTSWEYKLMTVAEFIAANPDQLDSAAITDTSKKEMHFIDECFDIGTVRHEVRHAFTAELCLASTTEMSLADFEEIQCTLDQDKWDQLDQTSQLIFHNLLK